MKVLMKMKLADEYNYPTYLGWVVFFVVYTIVAVALCCAYDAIFCSGYHGQF